MSAISAEQVKSAALAAGLSFVVNHDCAICRVDVGYVIDGEKLFYRSGCGCSWSPDREIPWQEAADWINLQSDEKVRRNVASRFAVTL